MKYITLMIDDLGVAGMKKSFYQLCKKIPRKISFFIALLMTLIVITTTVVWANNHTVVVEASVLNVRTGPGLSYDVMTQVMEEETLTVLDEKNEWYKVRLSDDKIGWVASWLVKNTEVTAASHSIGIISGTEVNVRQAATTDSLILGTVSKGEELPVLYQEKQWVQILFEGQVAWVSKDLIQVHSSSELTHTQDIEETSQEELKHVIIKGNGTNIRQGPSIDHQVITTANKGESFEYLESDGDWHKIQLPNKETGYIAAWTVDLSSHSVNETNVRIPVTSLAEATIVIDAGHGGHDPGAVNNHLVEKELTMKTARMLADKLKAFGTNVILTRDEDVAVSLNDRVYMGHSINADAFISIHYDAIETANSVSGTTTYYFSENEKELAEKINDQLHLNGPLNNNGVRKGNYFVLRENHQPSILLELGYINSTQDQRHIQTNHYRSIVTDSIIKGLVEYFRK